MARIRCSGQYSAAVGAGRLLVRAQADRQTVSVCLLVLLVRAQADMYQCVCLPACLPVGVWLSVWVFLVRPVAASAYIHSLYLTRRGDQASYMIRASERIAEDSQCLAILDGERASERAFSDTPRCKNTHGICMAHLRGRGVCIYIATPPCENTHGVCTTYPTARGATWLETLSTRQITHG
jgi:hypothetical protein